MPTVSTSLDLQVKASMVNLPEGASKADKLNAVGAFHHRQGRVDLARLHYDQALMEDPDHGVALQNLAAILLTGRNYLSALTMSRKALAFTPNNHAARANFSVALMYLGEYDQAKAEMEKVLAALPQAGPLWQNYGLLLNHTGFFKESLLAFDKSLELMPGCGPVMSDRALTLMALGQLSQGIKDYGPRWDTLYKGKSYQVLAPEWEGESVQNARFLLNHEQGFGDSVMLMRFARILTGLGARVTIAGPESLVPLYEAFGYKAWNWEDEAKLEDHKNDYDFQSPMLSCLGWLGFEAKDISARPYLSHVPSSSDLGPPGFRVGICWASGDHSFALQHRRRYAELPLFFPLLEVPGVRLVSLQKGEAEKDIMNFGAEAMIWNPMPRCANFLDTARVIAGLDLIIGVDSVVPHIAGALGKPCFMLGPYSRCWRWWGETNGWPWYENFRIFKQPRYGDWETPIAQAIEEVRRLVSSQALPEAAE